MEVSNEIGQMGSEMSREEKNVCRLMEAMIIKHNAKTGEFALRKFLRWVSQEVPGVDAIIIYDPAKWDEAGVKIRDQATRADPIALTLLAPWQIAFEVIKKHVGSKDQAEPSAPLLVRAASADEPEEDNSFDPRSINPDKEPDLCPPTCMIRGKTLRKRWKIRVM